MSLQHNTLASERPLIRGDGENTWVQLPGCAEVNLFQASVDRSKLLSGICESAECPWAAPLAIDAPALQQWLKHVQPGMLTIEQSI